MGNLYLAYNPGSSGTYNLSGSGLLSANTELIGYSGPATFNQSGGTNSILGNGLSLIAAANYTSVYNLSGSGVLTSTSEIVGQYGILNQSGGSNSTTTLTINANNGLSVGGSYVLSGVASLTASNGEYVSQTSPGLFTQIGGLNSTGFVNIGTQGTYRFSGGTLQVTSAGFTNRGIFDATGSNGIMSIAGSAIVDLSQAILVNTGSMSVNIGPRSLLLLPAGFDPNASFASFSNQGLTHNVGTPLVVPPGQGFVGAGNINDFVSCQGTIGASWTTSVGTFTSGINLTGRGLRFRQRQRQPLFRRLYCGQQSFSASGGTLTAATGYVGYSATGTFSHTGGSVTLGSLYLGYKAGSNGTYNLAGPAVLSTTNEYLARPAPGFLLRPPD